MSATPNYTEINVTGNYAPTAQATVAVTDAAGNPVAGAQVEFKLYNYAEFYTVAAKQTDASGQCSLTAGKGDMLVWASKDGRFGFRKLSFGTQEALSVPLEHRDGDVFEQDIDMMPPAESADLPAVTPGQRAENDRRMAVEDSIRNAYVATMMTQETAGEWAASQEGLDGARESVAGYLAAARGNHEAIKAFLASAAKRGEGGRAASLLGAISAKDLRDARPEVLEDHLVNTPEVACEQYVQALLNPRIATEELTAYKSFFQQAIGKDTAEAYVRQPQKLVEWCRTHITLNDTLNSQRIPMSPEGVWKARMADKYSRDIFFVAVARSLGIPAWIDRVTGKARYQDLKGGKAYDVDFAGGQAQAVLPTGGLAVSFSPTRVVADPKYYSHFTLSRCENGVLHLQSYNERTATWSGMFRPSLSMPAGYYVLASGTRLASGGVLANLKSVNVEAGKVARMALAMREDAGRVQVLGNFNSESLFTPVADGGVAAGPTSLLKASGRGYFVVGVLGVGQEPTNHALKDIAKLSRELEGWGRKMVLLFPGEEEYAKFRPQDFPGLPATVVYGIDTHGIAAQIMENMKLEHKHALPVFIIADTFNRVVFVSQGYTIGLGEQLVRAIRGI